MTLYLTKTWGFSDPSGPLQFSLAGWRDRARQLLIPGDLVVIVGTVGKQTDESERGQLLGLMEPTNIVVSSLDFELARGPEDYDEHGSYRWPFALELRSAWRFVEPRAYLIDITKRRFNMDAALGIVQLTEDEAAAILTLPRVAVPLLRPVRAAARVEGAEAARRRAAPPPTTTRTGVMHLRRAPAYTYAMRVENNRQSAFKIGWAFDWRQRMQQFNQAALPTLGGVRYSIVLAELWNTAIEAFRMEQSLLRQFDSLRQSENVEVVAPLLYDDLETAWKIYVQHARRVPRRLP